MNNTIYTAPTSNLKNLSNLFIELTAQSCNQRCRHCYIDFPLSRKVKDFISIDKIKEALNDSISENIKCIYLTGAEPMTHPDFNSILRLCLKRCNVCICTNGSFINEKKARFLKKVEDESNYQILFQISIDHYDEVKCDDIRGRGVYRQALNALKSLVKYNFIPIICITNYYKEDHSVLIYEFQNIFAKFGFNLTDDNFKINRWVDKNETSEQTEKSKWNSLDCEYGRVLTSKGIYSCPFLANDHRGRSGSSLKDYSKNCQLETNFCTNCIKNMNSYFAINLE